MADYNIQTKKDINKERYKNKMAAERRKRKWRTKERYKQDGG